MRLKVDENIGTAGVDLLRRAGHDTMTVREQGLPRFPPKGTAGMVVLELGGPASLTLLHSRLRDFLAFAVSRPVAGELWIIEPGRVRVHLDKDQ